jgi:hypothetical protein
MKIVRKRLSNFMRKGSAKEKHNRNSASKEAGRPISSTAVVVENGVESVSRNLPQSPSESRAKVSTHKESTEAHLRRRATTIGTTLIKKESIPRRASSPVQPITQLSVSNTERRHSASPNLSNNPRTDWEGYYHQNSTMRLIL